jgi:acetyltransferase-like isoleucine patch superfamily enzyme
MVASRVSILSGRHQHGSSQDTGAVAARQGSIVRVSVGRHTWVGESALIAADVGDNAIVGAGSVVVHPVPSRTTAVGNPARPIHRA